MAQVNIAEAKAHLSELVKSAICGQEVVIARDGKPLVRLVPVASTQPRLLGWSPNAVEFMADDFDATPEDFNEVAE